MSAREKAAELVAFDASNTQELYGAPAAYSRNNLARLFVGRTEARMLAQVEHALSDYNNANNTFYTILPNLIIRFKSRNRTHLRFVTRLLDPSTTKITTTATAAADVSKNNLNSASTSTALPNSTTSTTLNYTFVLQPSESLIYPVNEMSNESPVKDDTAWTTFGAQECARLERLMDQQGLQLTVYDVSRAAWRLIAVRRWLEGLQQDYDTGLGNNINSDTQKSGGVPAAAATTALSRPQSGFYPSLSTRNLVAALPRLVESLNDPAAIRKLASEIELTGDDDADADATGGADGSTREHDSSRKQRQQPDELLSMIPFITKPTNVPALPPPPFPPPPPLLMATAPIIKTEPEDQADTVKAINDEPLDTSKKATPPLAAVNTGDPSGSKFNNYKSKQVLPPQQKSNPTAENDGGSRNKRGAASTAINPNEKKRKQELDLAEKKSKGPIAWIPQPSHPEDQPLISNENKKKKKKSPTPAVKTLVPLSNKEEEAAVSPPIAGTSSRYKIFFLNIPSKATAYSPPPPPPPPPVATTMPTSLPTTELNPHHTQPNISLVTPGASIPVHKSILVPRERPSYIPPRYITTNTTATSASKKKRVWERILTRCDGTDVHSFSGEFLVRRVREAPQAPPPGAGFSSWFDQMHTEPSSPPPLQWEDIDPDARNTCEYFEEINPTIKTYGVFPEFTVRIPAIAPDAPPYEEVLGAGVGGVPPLTVGGAPSLENLQFTVANIVQPGNASHIEREENSNSIEPSPITTTTRQKQRPNLDPLPDLRQPQATKKPNTDTQLHANGKSTSGKKSQKQRASTDDDFAERGRRTALTGRPKPKYPSDDDYDDDYNSRSTYSRSRSRSYSRSRSRSRSGPPQRGRHLGTRLSEPRVWNDAFVNFRNRPQPEYLDLEQPSYCVWQLDSSSRIPRSSLQWQDKCFDPVWRYEMSLHDLLFKKKSLKAELVFKKHPLPAFYDQDFATFLKFITSRSHLFEVVWVGRTDDNNALIKLRDGAGAILEWKRRMLDYIRVEGKATVFRVPLAEAFLACPFPRDTPYSEIEEAQSYSNQYIISRLGDAVHVILPKLWRSTTVTYSTIELRFFECDTLRFPKKCGTYGVEHCTLGTSCSFLHVGKRNWGRPSSAANNRGRTKQV